MSYYLKAGDPTPWFFDDDGSQDHLITPDMTLMTPGQVAAINAPQPPTKDQRIAAILASKSLPMTRSEVWNAVLAANALAMAQSPITGRTPAEQLAYNRARNKYQRECEEMEASIRAVELEP